MYEIGRLGTTISLSGDPRAAALEALELGLRPTPGHQLADGYEGWTVTKGEGYLLVAWLAAERLRNQPLPEAPPGGNGWGDVSVNSPTWSRVATTDLPTDRWAVANYRRAGYSRPEVPGVIVDAREHFAPSVADAPSWEWALGRTTGGHYSSTLDGWRNFQLAPVATFWEDVTFAPREGFERVTAEYAVRVPCINGDGPYWCWARIHRCRY